jgi:hypothetical protein
MDPDWDKLKRTHSVICFSVASTGTSISHVTFIFIIHAPYPDISVPAADHISNSPLMVRVYQANQSPASFQPKHRP